LGKNRLSGEKSTFVHVLFFLCGNSKIRQQKRGMKVPLYFLKTIFNRTLLIGRLGN
jgi:hypothetical protein